MKAAAYVPFVVIGAGAAGCFGAIQAAEASRRPVLVLDKGRQPLAKVKISGGGRCNVTHACFDPALLVHHYPRGERELRGPFHRFQPRDTIEWFSRRGVETKTEPDGRMFPVTDSSQTVIDCLLGQMAALGVDLRLGLGVEGMKPGAEGGWILNLSDGSSVECDACLVATGSLSNNPMAVLLKDLGHTIVPPAPSLFTFKLPQNPLEGLAGLSVPAGEATIPALKASQRGPILVTHWGLSGPAVLRLSAWCARELQACGYQFELNVNWAGLSLEAVKESLDVLRRDHPRRQILNQGPDYLPRRLWQRLVELAGLTEVIWSQLKSGERDHLQQLVFAQPLKVSGKSTHKDEFVTCGGVSLREINFKTMESRLHPGLFFAGECLDIDGITGGFNFQAAWTTGFLAGSSMSGA
jgi:predicted Rossmann fold flavoprotein